MRAVRRGALVVAVLLAIALVGAACSDVNSVSLPTPPSTGVPTTTTLPPDFSGVHLAGVRGTTTTTTPAVGPGPAHLNGTVIGPGGPIGGATVRVERLVDNLSGFADVPTAADGTWRIDNIKGGRYRVRAWRAPDLATSAPQLFFLQGSDTRSVALSLEVKQGSVVSSSMAPTPPPVDQPVNLVVQLSSRAVDNQGIVRAVPQVGVQLTLTGTGSWQVRSPNPSTTDPNGRVAWQLICRSEGSQPLSVSFGAETVALNLAACFEQPPPTTSTTSFLDESTTTTTRKRGNGPP